MSAPNVTNFNTVSVATLKVEAQPGQPTVGNVVSASVATASTHKVSIEIGGVTYYLLATNVA